MNHHTCAARQVLMRHPKRRGSGRSLPLESSFQWLTNPNYIIRG
jgi:hypothetical protein